MSFWKVEITTPEKMFIRSLERVNPDDLEVQPPSPLLGPDRMRHHTSARNGKGFKKTLVLDLDETLISTRHTSVNCDDYEVRSRRCSLYVVCYRGELWWIVWDSLFFIVLLGFCMRA